MIEISRQSDGKQNMKKRKCETANQILKPQPTSDIATLLTVVAGRLTIRRLWSSWQPSRLSESIHPSRLRYLISVENLPQIRRAINLGYILQVPTYIVCVYLTLPKDDIALPSRRVTYSHPKLHPQYASSY